MRKITLLTATLACRSSSAPASRERPERPAGAVRRPVVQLALPRRQPSWRREPRLRRRGEGIDPPGQGRGHPGRRLPRHQRERARPERGRLRMRDVLDGVRARLRQQRALLRLLHPRRQPRPPLPADRGVQALGLQPRPRRSGEPPDRARDSPPQRRATTTAASSSSAPTGSSTSATGDGGNTPGNGQSLGTQLGKLLQDRSPRVGAHSATRCLQTTRSGMARAGTPTRSTPPGCAIPTASRSTARPAI